MLSIQLAIQEVLTGFMSHFKKVYCFPSQATMLEHLVTDHGVVISRRTLNRHLAAMVAGGKINRTRRHYKDAKLGMVFRSTLYTLGAMAPWVVGKLKRMVLRYATYLRVPHLAQYPKDVIITQKSSPASIGSILKNLRI